MIALQLHDPTNITIEEYLVTGGADTGAALLT